MPRRCNSVWYNSTDWLQWFCSWALQRNHPKVAMNTSDHPAAIHSWKTFWFSQHTVISKNLFWDRISGRHWPGSASGGIKQSQVSKKRWMTSPSNASNCRFKKNRSCVRHLETKKVFFLGCSVSYNIRQVPFLCTRKYLSKSSRIANDFYTQKPNNPLICLKMPLLSKKIIIQFQSSPHCNNSYITHLLN